MNGRPLGDRSHLSPIAGVGMGSARLNAFRNYFSAVNRPLAIWGLLMVIGALTLQLLPPAIRGNNVFNGALSFKLKGRSSM